MALFSHTGTSYPGLDTDGGGYREITWSVLTPRQFCLPALQDVNFPHLQQTPQLQKGKAPRKY